MYLIVEFLQAIMKQHLWGYFGKNGRKATSQLEKRIFFDQKAGKVF